MRLINKLRFRVAVIAISLIFLSLQLSNTKYWFLLDYWRHEVAEQLDKVSLYDYNALYLLSKNTVNVLKEREFLVVFGIPSLDIPIRRWRRRMQRTTCWRFPEVATRHNNYTGEMMVLYLLARHPLNNFILSNNVIREAEQWQDVVIHPMNEGRSTTSKHIDGKGLWRSEAEIGSSRKTFFWFYFALRHFPRVPYIAKGDDDIFLRVPQYLADLRRLPRQGIYWGGYKLAQHYINNKGAREYIGFMNGYCLTLARDAVGALLSFKPLRQLIWLPYGYAMLQKFRPLNMEGEDVMVGQVLNLSGHPIIWVADNAERFHIYNDTPPTENVVVTHIPKKNEYFLLLSQFLVNPTTAKPTRIIKQSSTFYLMQPPF